MDRSERVTTISFDIISAILAFACGIIGVVIGNGMRKLSHSVIFPRDPFFVFFCCFGWLVMLILGETGKVPFFATGLWNFMMFGFIIGYIAGFQLCNPRDYIQIDLPKEGGGTNSLILVYYIHHDELYMMPQAFGPICKAVIGVRYPLDMNLNAAKNGRQINVSCKIRKISVMAYPVAVHNMIPIIVGKWSIRPKKAVDEFGREYDKERWLLNFYAEQHKIRFAQTTIEDPVAFWRESNSYMQAIDHAVEVSEKYTRLQVDMQTMKYEAATDIVMGLVDMNIDASNFREDLFRRMNEELIRRTKIDDQMEGDQYAGTDEFETSAI
jgi:hypothetical protein